MAPNDPAVYVMLSNIYASKKRWTALKNTRTLMTSRYVCSLVTLSCHWHNTSNVHKTPGKAVVIVNGKEHEFTIDDNTHPDMAAIHEKWRQLREHMQAQGYLPDLSWSLKVSFWSELFWSLCLFVLQNYISMSTYLIFCPRMAV